MQSVSQGSPSTAMTPRPPMKATAATAASCQTSLMKTPSPDPAAGAPRLHGMLRIRRPGIVPARWTPACGSRGGRRGTGERDRRSDGRPAERGKGREGTGPEGRAGREGDGTAGADPERRDPITFGDGSGPRCDRGRRRQEGISGR
ncbi:hypothetical protein GCM10009605_49280 [Nocardiopsis composta]